MATHASAEKAYRQSVKHHQRNQQLRTRLRSTLKSVRAALDTAEPSKAKAALGQTTSIIDRMVTKGIIHRNAAARQKSRLARRLAKRSTSA